VPQVMAEIERDVTFYDESGGGVTISGGEPLMQPEFLLALLQACERAEFHTALDTCGLASWRTLDTVREYIDLFLYDLKLLDDVQHRRFTGMSNETILANLRALSREGHKIILRIPIIPGINDNEPTLNQIAEFAATLPHLAGVNLLPYHPTASDKYDRLGRVYELPDAHPPSTKDMAQLADRMRRYGFPVKIGG